MTTRWFVPVFRSLALFVFLACAASAKLSGTWITGHFDFGVAWRFGQHS